MGKITVIVDDHIEEEFRKVVAQKYGARRGALGAAMTEAMRMWIARTKAELKEWEEV